ncbi:MAG: methionyl-tRNA formyltransferase, partial [Dehalococcoidia bacterium]
MRLVFMGTPHFVIPVLEALIQASDLDIVGVYTPPDRPRGRGRNPEMTPVKQRALALGLPIFQPASLRSEAVQQELAKLQPEVIVVAAYGRFLPTPVLELPPYGCLNLHPSLLPRYRGPSPVVTTILEGETRTGVTLMRLDEGMDTGPLIAQRDYPVPPEATAESLTADLFRLGADLLVEALPQWIAGGLMAAPQDNAAATVTRKIERTDGKADWSLSALELQRRQRAYTPWPGLFTAWQGRLLKLLDVVALADANSLPVAPGKVVRPEGPEAPVGVGTGEGILGLRELQLE